VRIALIFLPMLLLAIRFLWSDIQEKRAELTSAKLRQGDTEEHLKDIEARRAEWTVD
jgi:hypothetical protein